MRHCLVLIGRDRRYCHLYYPATNPSEVITEGATYRRTTVQLKVPATQYYAAFSLLTLDVRLMASWI
jgi:hypothetical protein